MGKHDHGTKRGSQRGGVLMAQRDAREHRWRLWLAGIAMVLATVPWAAFLAWVIWSILEVQPPPTVQAGWLLPAQLVSSAVIVALAGWTTVRLWRGLMGAVRRSINWWGCPRCGFSLRGLRAVHGEDGRWSVTCPECGRQGTMAAVAVLGDGTVATEVEAGQWRSEEDRQAQRREWWRRLRRHGGWTLAVLGLLGAIICISAWRSKVDGERAIADDALSSRWRRPISADVERSVRRMSHVYKSPQAWDHLWERVPEQRHLLEQAFDAWQVFGFNEMFLWGRLSAAEMRSRIRDAIRSERLAGIPSGIHSWIEGSHTGATEAVPEAETADELISGLKAGVKMVGLEALTRAEEGNWPGAAEMLIAADRVGRELTSAAPPNTIVGFGEVRDVMLAVVARLVLEWPPESFLEPIVRSGMLDQPWVTRADARLHLRAHSQVGVDMVFRRARERPWMPFDTLVAADAGADRLTVVIRHLLFFRTGRYEDHILTDAQLDTLIDRVEDGEFFDYLIPHPQTPAAQIVSDTLSIGCYLLGSGFKYTEPRARAILLAIACQRHILQTGQTPGTLDDLRASGLLPGGLHPLVRPGRDIRLAVRRLPGRPPLVVVSSGDHLQVATRYADEGGIWFPYEGADLELPTVKHPGGVAAAEAERPKFPGTRAPP